MTATKKTPIKAPEGYELYACPSCNKDDDVVSYEFRNLPFIECEKCHLTFVGDYDEHLHENGIPVDLLVKWNLMSVRQFACNIVEVDFGDEDWTTCPVCHGDIYDTDTYCSTCGVEIKHKEDEDV